MAAYKEQCGSKSFAPRRSWRWCKQQYNRFMRRQAKHDPENAWRKKYYFGYFW